MELTMLQVNIGKGLTMDVDLSKLNHDVTEHVMKIGLRNILMDSHANATAKSDAAGYVAKSRELAEKKLASMYAGIVRAQSAGGGIAKPTDPVAQVILRLARKQVQKDRAEDLAAAPKDQRLALLNRLLTKYAETHEAALRPRAVKIVALENDEPEARPVTKPAKRK
jgi:hypothetical protein